MSTTNLGVYIILTALLTACGTQEMNARGVSAKDATEIGRLIHASVPSARIVSYTREPDGTIHVWTVDDHLYVADRVGGKWQFHEAP